jgi:hypothetical protein
VVIVSDMAQAAFLGGARRLYCFTGARYKLSAEIGVVIAVVVILNDIF